MKQREGLNRDSIKEQLERKNNSFELLKKNFASGYSSDAGGDDCNGSIKKLSPFSKKIQYQLCSNNIYGGMHQSKDQITSPDKSNMGLT